MKFTLHTSSGSTSFDAPGAGYLLQQGGVLRVTSGDGRVIIYSPSGWDRIEEADKPAPNARAWGRQSSF